MEQLYPVYCKGKKYSEEECDDVYTAFYHSRDALGFDGGVYMSEGIWIYPDGSTDEN